MLDYLIKKTIKDYDKIENINVRNKYGILASIIGAITNAILVLFKIVLGILTKQLSIVSNGIDNLSDFGNNAVTFVGFKIAKKPADDDHPFGHERVEYITGLIISMIIVFIGGCLGISSLNKIFNFNKFEISDTLFYITIILLGVSIFIKIIQSLIYKKLSKKINSSSLNDLHIDSLLDVISTFIVTCGLITNFILLKNGISLSFSLDGILGVIESILITISGINLVKNEIDLLIGKPFNKEFSVKVANYVNSYDKVYGVHDVMCHMYGPSKCYMVMHVLVDQNNNLREIDEYIEKIEEDVYDKFNIDLTIHIDPYDLENKDTLEYENKISNTLKLIDESLNYHDVRVLKCKGKKLLMFDLVVPFNYKYSNNVLNQYIKNEFKKENNLEIKIKFDNDYSK
jgi:cation diffusion facilitator family transporter